MKRDALLDRYGRHLTAQGLAKRTSDQYLDTARRFLTHVGARTRAQFSSAEYERYLVHRGRTISTQSVACEVYRLRPFFRALVALDLAQTDPSTRLRPKLAEPGPPLVLSEAKVARIFAAALRVPEHRGGRPVALRDRALVELAYGLGLRVSELVAARLSDVDARAGAVLVRRAKNGGEQVLPLPPSALRRVLEYVHRAACSSAREAGATTRAPSS